MKKDYTDASWLTDTAWGRWGKDDEVGALNELTPADVVRAVSLIKKVKYTILKQNVFMGSLYGTGIRDSILLHMQLRQEDAE